MGRSDGFPSTSFNHTVLLWFTSTLSPPGQTAIMATLCLCTDLMNIGSRRGRSQHADLGPFFGRAGLPRTCRSWPSTPWNTTRTQPSGTAEPMLDLGRSVLSSCPLIGRGGLQGRDQPLQVLAVPERDDRHLAAVATRSPTARVLISCSPFGVRINVPRRKQWPPECPQLWPRP